MYRRPCTYIEIRIDRLVVSTVFFFFFISWAFALTIKWSVPWRHFRLRDPDHFAFVGFTQMVSLVDPGAVHTGLSRITNIAQ